jgi:hypothetical protein
MSHLRQVSFGMRAPVRNPEAVPQTESMGISRRERVQMRIVNG